ncbi:MAG: hypothetical protein LLG20_25505 [Acidobacteriales bacterium]|nr:hypothetical protein [Terriglobales bacterium]
MLTAEMQAGGLAALGYVRELFQASGRENFTREQIVRLLELVMSDPELFGLDAQARYAAASAAVDARERAQVN